MALMAGRVSMDRPPSFMEAGEELTKVHRSAWQRGNERDLDLVIMDLLHTHSGFRRWLVGRVAPGAMPEDGEPCFVGAWHSVGTPNGESDGESDVEADWTGAGGGLSILIENKVRAAFQPDQGGRYQARAKAYVTSGRATTTKCVLVAPARYRNQDPAGCAPFDCHISIEDLAAWAQRDGDTVRGGYLGGFFTHLMQAWRACGTRTPLTDHTESTGPGTSRKPQFPEFYAALQPMLLAQGLSLASKAPGEWVFFDVPRVRKGMSLRWRLRDDWVELVFGLRATSVAELEERLIAVPLPNAMVAERGVSETVVWIPTPSVDPEADVIEQRAAIDEALSAVVALKRWVVESFSSAPATAP
jgi:hypothetical protein